MRLGVDCSNYTGDIILGPLQQAGVEFAIVGTQKPDIARQQIAALEAGGIEVPAVYCFLYWDGDDSDRIDEALTFGKPVWLDCEFIATPMPSPGAIEYTIRTAISHCGRQLAGIYTGYWWWPTYAANSGEWKEIPLWHADYRPRPESLVLSHTYGGWTKATIWQWSSAGLGGVNVDLNVMEDAVPEPTPTPPPQPSLPEVALAYARTYLIMSGADPTTQNLQDAKPEDIAALEWVVNTANGR